MKYNIPPADLQRYFVDYLKELFKADPDAISQIVSFRAECSNDALLDHPTVIVRLGTPTTIGFLGLLNGLFEKPEYRVAAIYDDDNRLVGFQNFIPPEES